MRRKKSWVTIFSLFFLPLSMSAVAPITKTKIDSRISNQTIGRVPGPDQSKDPVYIKILRDDDTHNGFRYRAGLNQLNRGFNNDPIQDCAHGGLYYTWLDKDKIKHWICIGTSFRVITEFPEDAQILQQPLSGKGRCSKMILGEKKWAFFKRETCEAFNINPVMLFEACETREMLDTFLAEYSVEELVDILYSSRSSTEFRSFIINTVSLPQMQDICLHPSCPMELAEMIFKIHLEYQGIDESTAEFLVKLTKRFPQADWNYGTKIVLNTLSFSPALSELEPRLVRRYVGNRIKDSLAVWMRDHIDKMSDSEKLEMLEQMSVEEEKEVTQAVVEVKKTETDEKEVDFNKNLTSWYGIKDFSSMQEVVNREWGSWSERDFPESLPVCHLLLNWLKNSSEEIPSSSAIAWLFDYLTLFPKLLDSNSLSVRKLWLTLFRFPENRCALDQYTGLVFPEHAKLSFSQVSLVPKKKDIISKFLQDQGIECKIEFQSIVVLELRNLFLCAYFELIALKHSGWKMTPANDGGGDTTHVSMIFDDGEYLFYLGQFADLSVFQSCLPDSVVFEEVYSEWE